MDTSEQITLQEWNDSLPEGIHLYDFGNKVLAAPTPDLNGASYLTTFMCFLTTVVDGQSYFSGLEISKLSSISGGTEPITIRTEEANQALRKFQMGLELTRREKEKKNGKSNKHG